MTHNQHQYRINTSNTNQIPLPQVSPLPQIFTVVLSSSSSWPCFVSQAVQTHRLLHPCLPQPCFPSHLPQAGQAGTLTLGHELSIQSHCSVTHGQSQLQKGGHAHVNGITSIFAFSLFSLSITAE